MRFYIAKGLQLAGLVGVGWALFAGIGGRATLGREVAMAAFGALMFYVGRSIES